MKTRLARQTDILRLRGLPADAVLAPSPLDDARGLASAVLMPGGEKVWIVEDDDGVAGYTQARPRRYVLGWELVRLSIRRGRDQQAVAIELMQEVLQFLQDRGIPRLFARTAEDSGAQNLLIRCGFSLLLSETVFVRPPRPTRAPDVTPMGMRYRMPQDAWPLRQLESSQTPQLISQLEGLTSSSWSMPRYRVFRRDEQTDLIIERDGDIVGWAGWSFVGAGAGAREHARLSVLTDSEHSELAGALLDYALYAIGSHRPGAQTIVKVRDYQEPLKTALRGHDFVETDRESVLIKYGRLETVPKGPRKLFELSPAPEPALQYRAPVRPTSHV